MKSQLPLLGMHDHLTVLATRMFLKVSDILAILILVACSSLDVSGLNLRADFFIVPGPYLPIVRAESPKVKTLDLLVGANVLNFDANSIGLNQRDLSYGPDARGFHFIQVATVVSLEDILDKGAPMTLQADGKAVVAAEASLLRFNANGTLDTSFVMRESGLTAKDIALRSNGDIVVTGSNKSCCGAFYF
jgi:hypothetical protein